MPVMYGSINISHKPLPFQPKIPPNANLEFSVEVKDIIRGKIQGEIAKIGPGRLAGLIACGTFLAISPLL